VICEKNRETKKFNLQICSFFKANASNRSKRVWTRLVFMKKVASTFIELYYRFTSSPCIAGIRQLLLCHAQECLSIYFGFHYFCNMFRFPRSFWQKKEHFANFVWLFYFQAFKTQIYKNFFYKTRKKYGIMCV